MPRCGKQFQIRLLDSVVPKAQIRAADWSTVWCTWFHEWQGNEKNVASTDDRHSRKGGHVVWSIKYIQFYFFCLHQVRCCSSLSAFTCILSSLCVSMMQLLLTCFERVGVVRWTWPLSAGAEHPELVLWSWAKIVNGYDMNTIWERVPVASVFTRTLTHAGACFGTYTHFDPIDHA